jgi:DNA-binding XRE family transcriptional regulator
MNGLGFSTARHILGMSQLEMATLLGVSERTLRRWEKDTQPISRGVEIEVLCLMRDVDGEVSGALRDGAAWMRHLEGRWNALIPATDEARRAAGWQADTDAWPLSMLRAIAGRVKWRQVLVVDIVKVWPPIPPSVIQAHPSGD